MSGEYQALYRKWRPLTFDDVIGQEHISETLKHSVSGGRVAHAYLFCGTRGTGKTSTAKILSRAVNCLNPQNGNPCNECEICRGISDGSIFDVYEIDAASNNGVDNIRELRDEVIYTPSGGCRYKVYIIDEVHMLSASAFNALLKTLEEPPAHVIFILATTEPSKLPATILSRCQRFDFRRISADEIARRIEKISAAENIGITPDAAELIAELANGSMRDGLSILDRCAACSESTLKRADVVEIVGIVDKSVLFDISDAIAEEDTGRALSGADSFLSRGKEAQSFIEDFIMHYRNLLIARASESADGLTEVSAQARERYAEQSGKYTLAKIISCISILGEQLSAAKRLSNPSVAVETAIVRMSSPQCADDRISLLARIESLEKKLSAGYVAPPQAVSQNGGAPQKASPAPEAAVDLRGKDADTKESCSETSAAKPWKYRDEALAKIKEVSKTLYMYMMGASITDTGSEIEVELNDAYAYETVAKPGGIKYLEDLFFGISGERKAVSAYKKGEKRAKPNNKKPSIDDIIAKKSLFGDKMNITE